MEESKVDTGGFLDASDAIIPIIDPQPAIDALVPNKPSKTHKAKSNHHKGVSKNEGLGVGGFFAILVFISILLYIFRKCRYMVNSSAPRYSTGSKSSSDHLSSLL